MPASVPDERSPQRKARDEKIAAEPHLPEPKLSSEAKPQPVETFLARHRPLAVPGVVENGLVRPLDPAIRLPEHSRVIIVASAAD